MSIFAGLNVVIAILGYFLFAIVQIFGNKSRSAFIFKALTITVSIWLTLIAIDTFFKINSVMLTRVDYYIGIIIATFYLLFCLSYPNSKINRKVKSVIHLALSIMGGLILCTDLIIKNTYVTTNQMIAWDYGNWAFVFFIYFISCWLLSIIILIKKYRKEKRRNLKMNILYAILGFFLGIIPSIVTTVILPEFGQCDNYILGPLSTFLWMLLTMCSMVKNQLFSIKLIGLQVLVFTVWIVVATHLSLIRNPDLLPDELMLLIVSVFFGAKLVFMTVEHIEKTKEIDRLQSKIRKYRIWLEILMDNK